MMETIQGHLYDFPRYYDLVFGSDWKAELDFLQACFQQHARRPVRHVFEPACGTGRLMFRLAQAGYQVSGLDLNERAVRYCNRRLVRHGFSAAALVADMTDFQLPRRVDTAFNMINSFRHLGSQAAAESHLRCLAGAVGKGGLYVLGLHLTPTAARACEEESWSARRGNLCVNTHLELTGRDLPRRQEHYRMTYDVWTPKQRLRIVDSLVFRTYTRPQLLELFAGLPQWEWVATYDFAYDISAPLELDDASEDVVLVVRRR